MTILFATYYITTLIGLVLLLVKSRYIGGVQSPLKHVVYVIIWPVRACFSLLNFIVKGERDGLYR
jgi:hypothetical protein